jgi:dephospho-CoA kinase
MKRTDKKNIVVGVSGIMGSGKTTVAKVFEGLGAARIDADEIGKELLKEPGIRGAIVDAFGDGVKNKRGGIDTAKLATAAFKTEERVRMLNEITRDALIARIRTKIEQHGETTDIVVVDAALLPEWGAREWLDVLIVVDSCEDTCLRRSCSDSRFKPASVRARMKHQFSRREKTDRADIIIPNYRSLEDLRERAAKVFSTLAGITGKG